jgi:hypothetical protein
MLSRSDELRTFLIHVGWAPHFVDVKPSSYIPHKLDRLISAPIGAAVCGNTELRERAAAS